MPMTDTGQIGPLAADLMDQVAAEHPDAEIGEVGIVVEVRYETHTVIEARSTEPRAWVAAALFERARMAINRLAP